MRQYARFLTPVLVALALGAPSGCNKQSSSTDESTGKSAGSTAPSPHGEARDSADPATPHTATTADPHAGQTHAAAAAGEALSLDGLAFTVPDGWKAGDIGTGPFPPVAVFNLSAVEGDAEGPQVRITHYPAMKGKDDMNLQRWLGQVTKEDGSSYSMDEAQLMVEEMGNVRLKVIDLSGNVKATMRDTPRPDNRMIAAIVDHPKGPHFVVAFGPRKSMEHWAGSIKLFLASAKFQG